MGIQRYLSYTQVFICLHFVRDFYGFSSIQETERVRLFVSSPLVNSCEELEAAFKPC